MNEIIHDPNDPECRCDECLTERASAPRRQVRSLADLFRAGRDRGILQPRRDYT